MLSPPTAALQPRAAEQRGGCSLPSSLGQDGASLTPGPEMGPAAAVPPPWGEPGLQQPQWLWR